MTPESGQISKRRRKNLTIELLRFLFASIVVVHHSRYVLGDDNCYFLGGSMAVEFFLFVSGYLLMASVQKASGSVLGSQTLQFILHKIKGFLPEFVIAWGIGFAFVAAVNRWNLHQLWAAFRDDFWELTLVKMSGLFTNGIDGAMWYLSAMLLAMAILYPLLVRFRDMMSHIGCPLLALFLYGYLCREYGHPRDPSLWTGLFYKGVLRTVAGLCVGVVIYMAVSRWKRRAPKGLTSLGNILIAAAQLLMLSVSVRYMWLYKPSEEDYFYMFLLMLLVLTAFAGWGMEAVLNSFLEKLQQKGMGRAQKAVPGAVLLLGKYSLPLYLGHLYFAQHIGDVPALAAMSSNAKMTIYLLLSAENGLLVMGLSGLWRRKGSGVCKALKKKLVR